MTAKGNHYTILGNDLIFENTAGEYWEYEYDLLTRLIAVRKSENGTDNLAIVASYTYDALNQRMRTDSTKYGTTWYAFGIDGNVLFKETEDEYEQYVYVAGKTFVLVTGNNEDTEEEIYYYLTNHIGSTEMVTDENGQVVWQNELTPFGISSGEIGIVHLQAKFTGKDFDMETQLYYFNARWYDPGIGRFVTEDPVKDGVNWYVYCANNPLVFFDPSGTVYIPADLNETGAWDEQKETYRQFRINKATSMLPADLPEYAHSRIIAFYTKEWSKEMDVVFAYEKAVLLALQFYRYAQKHG